MGTVRIDKIVHIEKQKLNVIHFLPSIVWVTENDMTVRKNELLVVDI